MLYKVFLADDEPFILDGMKAIINWNEFGFEVVGQAKNGVEALELLGRTTADILITDITMPRMNGLELIKELKRSAPWMKHIVLSGYSEFDYVKQGMTLGIENYLLKPLNVQELLLTLGNAREKLEYVRYREIHESRVNNILRENVLHRWTTRRIGAMELRERARLLDLELGHAFYQASVIKLSAGGQGEEPQPDPACKTEMARVLEYCSGKIGYSPSRSCYSLFDEEIVLVFGIDSEEEMPQVEAFIEMIRDGIASGFSIDFFMTVGNWQPGFENLHLSHEQAVRLQDNHRIGTSGDICRMDGSVCPPEEAISSHHTDCRKMSRMVFSKDRATLTATVRQVFASIRDNPYMTTAILHNLCMDMIVQIRRAVEDVEQDPLSGPEYRELFLEITGTDSVQRLEQLVLQVAGQATESLAAEERRMSPVIWQVLNHVNHHLTEELSLKTLGYMLNVNPVYLGQLFQRETGKLFNEYVNELKMRKAMQLLVNTDMKAGDIARNVGFADPSYFFRQFKKYYGTSPSDLRTRRTQEARAVEAAPSDR